jgi:hypothetical protein
MHIPVEEEEDEEMLENEGFQGFNRDSAVETIIPETVVHETTTKPETIFEFHMKDDDLSTETFYVDGFSTPFNLAGLRKNVQQYANKHFTGTGHASTNIANGRKFYFKYLSRAKSEDVAELKSMLRMKYPQFLNEILKP